MMMTQARAAVLMVAIIAVQCGIAAEDSGWDNGDSRPPPCAVKSPLMSFFIPGDVDGDLARLGESLQAGATAAAPASKLAQQNEQLQGAISAIENGTPPKGMEGMMGGAPEAEDGDAPGAPAAAAPTGGQSELRSPTEDGKNEG